VIVVGGSYSERCVRPEITRLRGSGLRAAIALRGLAPDLTLHTAVAEAERVEFDSVVAAFGIKAEVRRRTSSVTFSYFTPVSPPAIDGLDAVIEDSLDVSARTVLRFGTIEASPTGLKCSTLVIDPQGDGPLPLANTQHERLAVVGNEREIKRLARDDDVQRGARKLLESLGAGAVVVKCGARGAVVASANGTELVGPHPTLVVRPIGSGDVFSASFAWAYGERGDDPVSAAEFASSATGVWVSGVEPMLAPETAPAILPFGDLVPIYLAGPFFGLAQSWLVDTARRALTELGSQPFSPYHDVGLGGPEVAEADLAGLAGCRAMLALLDDFDAGTVFEVGYAVRHEQPVVAYVDPAPRDRLVMFEGSGVEVTHDFATAVYRAVWRGLGAA
jgi:hypothetical protein